MAQTEKMHHTVQKEKKEKEKKRRRRRKEKKTAKNPDAENTPMRGHANTMQITPTPTRARCVPQRCSSTVIVTLMEDASRSGSVQEGRISDQNEQYVLNWSVFLWLHVRPGALALAVFQKVRTGRD